MDVIVFDLSKNNLIIGWKKTNSEKKRQENCGFHMEIAVKDFLLLAMINDDNLLATLNSDTQFFA